MDLTKFSKGKRMVREDKIKLINELKKVVEQANTAIEELKDDVAAIPVVVANPTLEGTEAELEGLEVGGTKYSIPSGGENHLYSIALEVIMLDINSDSDKYSQYRVSILSSVNLQEITYQQLISITNSEYLANGFYSKDGGSTEEATIKVEFMPNQLLLTFVENGQVQQELFNISNIGTLEINIENSIQIF